MCVILERFGAEGYGIYWALLEHVALSIEKGSDAVPSRIHSVVKWSEILGCSARRFRQFAQIATELRLIDSSSPADLVQFSSRTPADRLQIDIPKLLKYRDEYSQRSGQTPEQIRGRADTEQRREETAAPKRVNSDPDDESAPKTPSAPLPNFKAAAQSIWEVWLPKRRPTAATIERYLRTRVKEHKGDAIADLEFLVKNAKAYNESEGEWAKGAEVWFGKNGYCWSPIASGSLFAQNGNGTHPHAALPPIMTRYKEAPSVFPPKQKEPTI